MDIFAQRKTLIRVVIVLVLINFASIGFLIWKEYIKKPEKKIKDANEISDILEKELNLSQQQAEQIKKLRKDFFDKEKIISADIRSGRDSMNVLMYSKNTDEALLNSIAKRIADNEYKMELSRIEQSKQLKAICTPEQLEKFENLVKEIKDYFKPEETKKNKQKDKEKGNK